MKKLILALFVLFLAFQGCGSAKKDPYKYVLEDSVAQRILAEGIKIEQSARTQELQSNPYLVAILPFSSPVHMYSLPVKGCAPLEEGYFQISTMRSEFGSVNSFVLSYEKKREGGDIFGFEVDETVQFVYDYDKPEGWIECCHPVVTDSSTTYAYDDGETAYRKYQDIDSKKEYIMSFKPANLAHISPTAKKGKRVC